MMSPQQLCSRSGKHPQTCFRRWPSSHVAALHSIPHEVISQVIRPDVAAFMADKRVVVRTHHDELCCVDKVKHMTASPLCEVDIDFLEQFPHLVRVDLGGKAIDAAQLVLLAKLSLHHLCLRHCHGVDAAGLASVGKLTQLRQLDLSYFDGVNTAGLAEVGRLTELQHLDLSYCDGVDAAGLAEISKLTLLQHLDISHCGGVDTAGLTEVGKLAQLQHLDISCCSSVDTAGLGSVSKLLQLRRLELCYCSVETAGLAEVSKLLNLRHLDLAGCHVNTAGLAEVGKLPQLQHLDLSGCHGIDDDPQLAVLRRKLPKVVRW